MTIPYDFRAMERRWRAYWTDSDLYRTGDEPGRPHHYILDFFPYPSGEGLSVGHCRNYVPTCISARYRRMTGHNVLHPMGWDAFGLPAENYAIQTGQHPAKTTQRQAANYRRQLSLVECSYDWSREINSTDPAYYRWTQWIFRLLFQRGLAYQAEGEQWWCPSCNTILANEQVDKGGCWRCDTQVTRKRLTQWYFRITAYADRLLSDLDEVDWPDSIKSMQRNWIGRSEGVEIDFPAGNHVIPVFTTRPDTLFGVTFLVLAPEHPLLEHLTVPGQSAAVAAYCEQARRRSEIERLTGDGEPGGVFTGSFAAHPITATAIPIYVADYVLGSYGAGAIMGVPAHDERDWAFARRFGLPVRIVIVPANAAGADRPVGPDQPGAEDPPAATSTRVGSICYPGEGELVDSGAYTGLTSAVAAARLIDDLERHGWGRRRVNYKLRDWLISRQRYWGAPIPIVHCAQCGPVAVPESALPVRLPEVDDYEPAGDGRSPLARASHWVETECPRCGGPARRETDTMDGFACSSWYFLRFANPHYDQGPFDPEAVATWLPVDVYVGGAEHAVLHLLYARFWTKVLYDAGLIDFTEPFQQLRNQGTLHAPDGRRMSKSRGNVITPDSVVAAHGADALRAYVVFLGPFEGQVTWDEAGINGVNRFLERAWAWAQWAVDRPDPERPDAAATRALRQRQHRAIEKLSADMAAFKFNTAVAELMGWLNDLNAARDRPIPAAAWREAVRTFARLCAPITPFIAESIWRELLGQPDSVHRQPWPVFDPALARPAEVTVVIQVNGRVRDRMVAQAGTGDQALAAAARSRQLIQRRLRDRPVRRVIVVPDRLVNFVTA